MNSGRWSARKEEALIVKRRNAEVEHQQMWNGVTQYFKTWSVQANKYSNWTSPQYYLHSANTQLQSVKDEKKKQILDERRKKLGALVLRENESFEAELKSHRARNDKVGMSDMPLQDLVNINLELKRRTEDARRREAELKLYHHWSSNQPSVRDYQRHLNSQFVKQAWFDQIKERHMQLEKAKREEAELVRRKQKEKAEQEARRKEDEARKRDLAVALQKQLQEQIQELKDKEKESEELKKEESNELLLKDQLKELTFQRHLEEHKKKNQEHRKMNRQYEQKLKQRAREVVKVLEEEKKNLDSVLAALLVHGEKEESQKKSALRNLMSYNVMLSEQVAKERIREKEYNNSFSLGEARNMWETQEAQWKKEASLREGLAKDVLDGVKGQLEERLKSNLQSQLAVVQDREELLRKLETTKREMEGLATEVSSIRQTRNDEEVLCQYKTSEVF